MLLQDYLFEAKLANMVVLPKVIDEAYLKAEDKTLLLRMLPEYVEVKKSGLGFEHLVHTHMYDQVRISSVILFSKYIKYR